MARISKVMRYEDIEAAQANRAAKEVERGKRKRGRKLNVVADEEDDFEPGSEQQAARMVELPQLRKVLVVRMY